MFAQRLFLLTEYSQGTFQVGCFKNRSLENYLSSSRFLFIGFSNRDILQDTAERMGSLSHKEVTETDPLLLTGGFLRSE